MGPGGFAWAGGGPAPTGGEQGRGVFIQGAQNFHLGEKVLETERGDGCITR